MEDDKDALDRKLRLTEGDLDKAEDKISNLMDKLDEKEEELTTLKAYAITIQ